MEGKPITGGGVPLPPRRIKLTAKQFTAYRKRLFLHPTEAAEALGITYNALNHWESGRRKVPIWAVKFLACLEANRTGSVQSSPSVQ